MVGRKLSYDFLLSKSGKRISKLLIFLYTHDAERFTFSELKSMNFFNNSSELSHFLKFAEETNLIRKTVRRVGSKTYALYEIRIFAHIFVRHLKNFINY